MQVMQEQLPAHALVADGVFYPSGSFRVLPPIPEAALAEGLRHRLLDVLCEEAGFDPQLAARMRQWQHSGFSIHNQIRVKAGDAAGRQQLACYMIRTPFALPRPSGSPCCWRTFPTSMNTCSATTAGTATGRGDSAAPQPTRRPTPPPCTSMKPRSTAPPAPTRPGSSAKSTK